MLPIGVTNSQNTILRSSPHIPTRISSEFSRKKERKKHTTEEPKTVQIQRCHWSELARTAEQWQNLFLAEIIKNGQKIFTWLPPPKTACFWLNTREISVSWFLIDFLKNSKNVKSHQNCMFLTKHTKNFSLVVFDWFFKKSQKISKTTKTTCFWLNTRKISLTFGHSSAGMHF